jgi:serine/threonine protein kinase
MPTNRAPNCEPIPGYRLLEPLGRGGYGEVWKCEAPGGLFKAIKFVPGPGDALSDSGGGARRELKALQLIKTIRHPFLLALDRVETVDGDLVVVMELADKSLHDLLQEHRRAGRLGVPREELLGYLREAAEVLDLMNHEHQLQHLDVKPRNLFLLHQHVKLADFGLVGDLGGGLPDSDISESITPLYAAPETFLGKITAFSDQYSLAITYQELLTGILPFAGKNVRQLALAHVQGLPDLSPLPEADRPVVTRALAKEPKARFASCLEFVAALEAVGPGHLPSVRRLRNTPTELTLDELAHTSVSGDTAPRTPSARKANPVAGGSALVSGHQLLECIGRLPVGEIWKARSANGSPRLIKLILAPEPPADDADTDPVALLQSLRHESLAPLEIVRCPGRRLALITDPGDGTLLERLTEGQHSGLPGIARPELLNLLRPVADALDDLYRTYRIQHLGLTPRMLVLHGEQVRILDYGLIELLWIPAGFEAPAVNTRYCAPELFARQSSRVCDQYSLALIYQELLTSVHAFRNVNPRQMANPRLRGNPDVGLLPGTDRPIVLRALHLDPDQRYSSCAEFIAALDEIGMPGPSEGPAHWGHASGGAASRPSGFASAHARAGRQPRANLHPQTAGELRKLIAAEVAAASAGREFLATDSIRYALCRGGCKGSADELQLEAHCFGRLLPGTVSLKLEGFREQWRAERWAVPDGKKGEGGAVVVFFLRMCTSLWQKAIGRQPGLEVRLDLRIPADGSDKLSEVIVHLRTHGCSGERAEEVLTQQGPRILESLRSCLQLHTEQRSEPRMPYPLPLQVEPLLPGGQVGEAILAQGKDITTGGIGLYLPCPPTTSEVYLHLSPAHRDPFTVPARVVRCHPCQDGRFEVGLCFAWDEI